ncbi:MAG: hypothetical protein V4524_03405 [Patescibacteria group bacterium]
MTKNIKYVPILKWKAGEMAALSNISSIDKKHVVPLIELVLPSVNTHKDKERTIKKTDDEIHAEMVEKMLSSRLGEIPEEIKEFWGVDKIYVDVTLLHDRHKTSELKIETLNKLVEEGRIKGIEIVPVFNVADEHSIVNNIGQLISKKLINEVCLRVTPSNLRDIDILDKKISDLLVNVLKVSKEDTHLLIDLKYLDHSPETYGLLFDKAQKITGLKQFKEFIFASGAFPVDMSECPIDESTYLPRTDWTSWESNVLKNGVNRIPTYSDYSIRHPMYNDSLQFIESTSTLKYTLGPQWMIMKGKKRALHLYLTNASLLVLQPEFKSATYGMGEKFSWGDKKICEKAEHFKVYAKDNSVKGTGRTWDWIAYGISHHTAVVIHQLSNLVG